MSADSLTPEAEIVDTELLIYFAFACKINEFEHFSTSIFLYVSALLLIKLLYSHPSCENQIIWGCNIINSVEHICAPGLKFSHAIFSRTENM